MIARPTDRAFKGSAVRIVLPKLYPKQHGAFFCPERISLTHASTKAGKTVAAITWQFSQCWGDGAGKAHLWVAPIFPQAKVAFERVVRMLTRADPQKRIWTDNRSDLLITFSNGSRWFFKGSDNSDSIYASDYYSVVVDEASRCKEAAWHAVVSTTTKTRGLIRAIGNMIGRKDWFYHLCNKAKAGEPGMAYSIITWKDAVEAGVLKEEVVEEQRRLLPPMIFRALYECVPAEDGANPFGYAAIASCVRPISILPPVCFGVDLASTQDWTVIVGLDAVRNTSVFDRWQGPWEVTFPKLVKYIGHLPAFVDSSGVGAPVVERLIRECSRVEGFQTGSGSNKIGLVGGLIQSIQTGKIGFPDNSGACPIRSELESYEYSLTATQKISYSAPQGSHDDCVIALGLADMAAERLGTVAAPFIEVIGSDSFDSSDDRMWTSVGDGW